MEDTITRALGDLLLPPGILILLLWTGIALLARRPRAGRLLIALAALLLTLLSLPAVSRALCRGLEVYPTLDEHVLDRGAGAIIVLAGGWTRAPEYGGYTVSALTLERLRYAVHLHRLTGLPLLLTGGEGDVSGPAEAELMDEALRRDFGLAARWIDTESHNTAENARNAAAMLKSHGIARAYLVSHAYHLARAVPRFQAQGLGVIPAPTRPHAPPGGRFKVSDLLPSYHTLAWSYLALHEYLGRLWYGIRY